MMGVKFRNFFTVTFQSQSGTFCPNDLAKALLPMTSTTPNAMQVRYLMTFGTEGNSVMLISLLAVVTVDSE